MSATGLEGDDLDMLPGVIPIFPLSNAILLPYCVLPLNIFEPRYLEMIRDAASGAGVIGMAQPMPDRPGHPNEGDNPDVFAVGGAGRLRTMEETDDGRLMIELLGFSRFKILQEMDVTTPYRQVQVDWAPYADDREPDFEAKDMDREPLLAALNAYLDAQDLSADIRSLSEAPDLVLTNSLAMILPLEPTEKQALLETEDIAERVKTLTLILDMAAREMPETSGDLN